MANENLASAYLVQGTIGNTGLPGAPIVHYSLVVVPSQNAVSGTVEVRQDVQDGHYGGNVTGKIYATGLGSATQIATVSGLIYSGVEGADPISFEAHLAVDDDWEGTGGFSYADTHVGNVPVQPDNAGKVLISNILEAHLKNLKQVDIAADFQSFHDRSMDEAKLDETVQHLSMLRGSSDDPYPPSDIVAVGKIESFLISVTASCSVLFGKSFSGSGWGASFPGGGVIFGYVNLSNGNTIDDLYRKTVKFSVYAVPVYTAFFLYDSGDNLLGFFHGTSFSDVAGYFSGSGGWS